MKIYKCTLCNHAVKSSIVINGDPCLSTHCIGGGLYSERKPERDERRLMHRRSDLKMINCYVGQRWVGQLPISQPLGDEVQFKGPDIDIWTRKIIRAQKARRATFKYGHIQAWFVLSFNSKEEFDYVSKQYTEATE